MRFWRKTLDDLRAWAASPYRRSLILRGARQVGKTTAVRLFAADFDTFIELNLERESDRDLFFSGTEVQKILNNIKIAKNIGDTRGKTLLFIFMDEPKRILRSAFTMVANLHETQALQHAKKAGITPAFHNLLSFLFR